MNNSNENKLDDLKSKISSLHFQQSHEDGSSIILPIRLCENGEIYGHSSPNEYTWKIDDGELFFYAKNGQLSTKFGRPFIEEGKLTFIGDFVLHPRITIKNKLQEIDFSLGSINVHSALTKISLQDFIKKLQWEIGDHTYGKPRILEPGMAGLKIGKFCSIAAGVTIILGNHNINTVTTYPFSSLKNFWPGARRDSLRDHHTNGDVVIGNDVWLGFNVTIMSGVTIGDGAVIAANSVVTKDVIPYSIVGGSPAKILRMRHDDSVIEELMKIQWWSWSDEVIDERVRFLLSDVDDFIKRFK